MFKFILKFEFQHALNVYFLGFIMQMARIIMVVLWMVIQQIGAQRNWKKAHTFLVLEIGNIVMQAAQYILMLPHHFHVS